MRSVNNIVWKKAIAAECVLIFNVLYIAALIVNVEERKKNKSKNRERERKDEK